MPHLIGPCRFTTSAWKERRPIYISRLNCLYHMNDLNTHAKFNMLSRMTFSCNGCVSQVSQPSNIRVDYTAVLTHGMLLPAPISFLIKLIKMLHRSIMGCVAWRKKQQLRGYFLFKCSVSQANTKRIPPSLGWAGLGWAGPEQSAKESQHPSFLQTLCPFLRALIHLVPLMYW